MERGTRTRITHEKGPDQSGLGPSFKSQLPLCLSYALATSEGIFHALWSVWRSSSARSESGAPR